MKRLTKVTIILLISVVLVLLLLLSPILLIGFWRQSRDQKIKKEVFSYIKDNQHQISLDDAMRFQEFEYTSWGFTDAGVIYGYYYTPEDEYQFKGSPYRNGYLKYGTPNSGKDWYYHERICENWYYYEEHFG